MRTLLGGLLPRLGLASRRPERRRMGALTRGQLGDRDAPIAMRRIRMDHATA